MRRQLVYYILIAAFASATTALSSRAEAQSLPRRNADLEWDAIDGALRYELEIRSLVDKNAKPARFFTDIAQWKGRLKPGKYSLRLRAYDQRNVSGDWGDVSEFWVKIGAPDKRSPKSGSNVSTEEVENFDQLFEWAGVEGALEYRIDVLDAKSNEIVSTKTTRALSVSLRLPVGRSYKWRVIGLMTENEPGEDDSTPFPLTLRGAKLDSPRILDPETEYVREVSWQNVRKAQGYQVTLDRQLEDGTWKNVEKHGSLGATTIPFKETHPGGLYRMRVQAVAPHRPPSAIGSREFYVVEGDRSEEAANLARLRQSLEKPSSYYLIASYFVTNVRYEGVVRERATEVSFDAVGGTGRVGFGYILPRSPWAGYIVADVSGFNIRGKTNTFAAAEAHVTWRKAWNVSLLRLSGGVFYKELPEASGYGLAGASSAVEVSRVSALGPHIGFEYLHPFSYKFGAQANARIYSSLLGLSTPNGQSLLPETSIQLSILGSYRLSRDAVGFAGYSYRRDRASYRAKPGDPSVPGSGAAKEGDVNSVGITGHYLNLIFEYSF